MMRRSTVILLIILAVMVAFFVYLKYRPTATTEETPDFITSYLFTAEDGDVIGISIEGEDQRIIAIERSSAGTWEILLPEPGEADQGACEAAATQVTKLRILNTLETAPPADTIGFNPPAYLMTINFAEGKTYIIEIGDTTVTESGYYIQFNETIYVISTDGISALLGLLEAPPYPPTPTQELPTETPSVTPTGDLTPLAEETPTPEITPQATTEGSATP